jgi:hypothetical protein
MLGIVTLLAGCSVFGTLEADVNDDPAVIIFYYDTASVIVPGIVNAGSEFKVIVNTYTGSCTTGIARTEHTVVGRVVEISSIQLDQDDSWRARTTDGLMLEHSAQFRVDTPGPFTIRVFGTQRLNSSAKRHCTRADHAGNHRSLSTFSA